MSTPQQVETTLNYLDEMAERPAVYNYEPPAGVARSNTRVRRHAVAILDARAQPEKLSLDEQGVELHLDQSSVSDFYDPEQVRAIYYPEMEVLVARATGARRVLAFDHNVRNAELAGRRERGAQAPVRFVHNDYTESSGPQRVRDLLGAVEAAPLLARRFAVINVWRPISGPVLESPLAVCDARSIAAGQLVPTDLKYRDRTGEVYSVAWSPEHRWLYFPRMQPGEAMLIKCYDSSREVAARYTAHSAFRDPTSPADAPTRQSIEVRTLAFY